jgi:hypothetical protein
MKIAIIGGGWVGCHLASKLIDSHEVVLFEKNRSLFQETSYNNQNRLHLGYHYARSYTTRKLCTDTFNRFLSDYGFLTNTVQSNKYCIPLRESIIDYQTYKKIFDITTTDEIPQILSNIQGCVDTQERYIDFTKAKEYFTKKLHKVFTQRAIESSELQELSTKYDFVINATNNMLESGTGQRGFYELTVSFIYEKIQEIPFGAITLVDGELFSIYPYNNNMYTLTDVEYTPLTSCTSVKDLAEQKQSISTDLIQSRQLLAEAKVQKYFPEFLKYFKYKSHYISTKVKTLNKSADRYPVINKQGNVINCFTGKIQGIYIIEDFIQNEINSRT